MNTGHIETLEESLVKAVKAQDRNEVRLLLELHARLDRRDEHGQTVLHYAAEFFDTGILEDLLASPKAEPDIRDEDGQTPLHHAALANRERAARLLLAKGADIDAVNRWGMTPLMRAAQTLLADTGDAVHELLKRGADMDAQDESGRTALHYAAGSPNTKGLAALVSAGANTEARDKSGKTPLESLRLQDSSNPRVALAASILTSAGVQKHLKQGAGKPVAAPKTARFSPK